MSKYLDEAEFFEQDLNARRAQHRWQERSRKLLASQPDLLEDGFQQQDGPEVDPSTVGLESSYDKIPLEDLVAIGQEMEERATTKKPRYVDWDEITGNAPNWSAR